MGFAETTYLAKLSLQGYCWLRVSNKSEKPLHSPQRIQFFQLFTSDKQRCGRYVVAYQLNKSILANNLGD